MGIGALGYHLREVLLTDAVREALECCLPLALGNDTSLFIRSNLSVYYRSVANHVPLKSCDANFFMFVSFASIMEPKKDDEAPIDHNWITAMQEGLAQLEVNKVRKLVLKQLGKSIFGTKSVFKNKMDPDGVAVRNKAKLIA